MPRHKQTQLDHRLLYQRWKVFGLWLRERRLMRGLTHAEIAQAVGVSRRQWVRYEQGSKMLRKRMPTVARTLNVPLETLLARAGYRTSPRRNDVKGRLARMADMLFAGGLDYAVLELLRLNERIAGNKGGVAPRAGGLSATDLLTL